MMMIYQELNETWEYFMKRLGVILFGMIVAAIVLSLTPKASARGTTPPPPNPITTN